MAVQTRTHAGLRASQAFAAQIMTAIHSNVSFEGASGSVSFLRNGDRDPGSLGFVLNNWVVTPDGLVARTVNGPLTTRSLLTTHSSLPTTHHSPLTTHHSLLTTHYSLLTAHCSLLTAHRSPLTTHHSPLTIHHSPLTTNHSLLTTLYSLLSTYCS